MERHDPEEGPSVRRYVLGRNGRGRLASALVSDIETVEGDSYSSTLRPQSSVLGSDTSSVYQYSPPGTSGGESLGRTHSLTLPPHSLARRLETLSDAAVLDDGDVDTFGVSRVSVTRPSRRHSDSVHTESSYGVIDAEGPTIISGNGSSTPTIPPPIPIKDQKRPMLRNRPSSIHTASSYALYTPRTPGKQVRFSEEYASATPGVKDVPDLPPHALDALRANTQASKPKNPNFFYGPPPLHGDDISPPTYATPKAANTDDEEGLSWSEKVGLFDPNDNDPTKPWYRRKKGYCFWIICALACLTIIFGLVVGVVVGVKLSKESNQEPWSVPTSNGTDFLPPGGFLGTWAFTTNLLNQSTACAPTAEGASNDLWRCAPFQTPPSQNTITWSFIISGNAAAGSNSENVQQLMISSAGNPFSVTVPPQQLNLTRYLTNAYYQFSMSYTKTSILTINGRTATCEFPNSILTGTLYINNTIFAIRNAPYATKPASQVDIRGEWPGEVVITEEKFGGGRQVVCRDRGNDNVIDLRDLTDTNGNGNCLCNYQNFGI